MANNVYQIVTDRIISQLQEGEIPWEKPWVNTSGTVVARSHGDGRVYTLLNQMLLQIPGEYVTFKQVEKAGGHVKKGAKAAKVVFWKLYAKDRIDADGNAIVKDDGSPERDSIPVLKYFNVFHIEDTEGMTPKYVQSKGPVADNQPIEEAEKAIADYLARSGLTLRHYEQGKSYYSPSQDEVVLPHMDQFINPESYYATAFHELTHSTGHKDRLARTFGNMFGDELYSKEELVAEIGSAVLMNHFGLDSSKIQRNTAAYVQNWLKVLKDDNKLIVSAASRAEKAVNMILNIQPKQKDQEPAPEA